MSKKPAVPQCKQCLQRLVVRILIFLKLHIFKWEKYLASLVLEDETILTVCLLTCLGAGEECPVMVGV